MILKMYSLTPKVYVKSNLNCFDGIISITGILELGLIVLYKL